MDCGGGGLPLLILPDMYLALLVDGGAIDFVPAPLSRDLIAQEDIVYIVAVVVCDVLDLPVEVFPDIDVVLADDGGTVEGEAAPLAAALAA